VAKPKITRSQSARKLTKQKTDVSFTDDSDDELFNITGSSDDENFAFETLHRDSDRFELPVMKKQATIKPPTIQRRLTDPAHVELHGGSKSKPAITRSKPVIQRRLTDPAHVELHGSKSST